MTSDSEKWKISDIIYGVIVPVIVAIILVAWPTTIASALLSIDPSYALNAIFVDGLREAVLIVAVPMIFGLLWNQWAGGASGFLLGSIYALYWSVQFAQFGYSPTDVSLLGYLVSAMLTGYIAGALNKGSFSFRRMVVAGLVAGIIGGAILLWTFIISPVGMATDIPYNTFIIMLPRIIYGIVMPIIVKVFSWYGITPRRMS